MERKALFKSNIFSPRQKQLEKRKATQNSRHENRKILFQKQRNIEEEESPKLALGKNFHDGQEKEKKYKFVSSTPMANKENFYISRCNMEMEGNVQPHKRMDQTESAEIFDNQHKNEEKLSKQQEYIQRLIAFKEKKKILLEQAKDNVKKPFLPAGKLKTKTISVTHTTALPTVSAGNALNHSIYSTVPTPVKKKAKDKEEPRKLQNRNAFNFVSKSQMAQPIVRSYVPTKAITKNSCAKVPVNNVLVNKPDGQSTKTGAIAKAMTFQRKQKDIAPPAQNNHKVHTKTKLAVSMKAKKSSNILKAKAITAATKTDMKHTKPRSQAKILQNFANPAEPSTKKVNTEKFGFFVTSTQTKRISSKGGLTQLDFKNACKTISPIETTGMQIQKAPKTPSGSLASGSQTVSAKRALILNPIKQKKYNFVEDIELDATVVDSNVAPKKMINTTLQKASELEETLLPNIANSMGREQETAANQQTPSKSRKQYPSNNNSYKAKMYNFVEEIELDATALESPITKNKRKSKEVPVHNNVSVVPSEMSTPPSSSQPLDRPINYVSPFVTVSRGKVSARKELEKRNSIYLRNTPTNTENPTLSAQIEVTPIEQRRAREAVRYFRQQLEREIEYLQERCNVWDSYKSENMEMLKSNDGDDMINVTIGQTKLLMNKKFMQFSGLIDRCEAHVNGYAVPDDGSEDTKPITTVDLEGFWSMLRLQVENVEKRFENLERWKSNDWQDPDAIKLQPRIRNAVKKAKMPTAAGRVATKPRANSALREMIRKKMKEMNAKNEEEPEVQIQLSGEPRSSAEKIFPINNESRRASLTRPQNTSGRICIVVPDRKARSVARTVISVPSPVRLSPLLSPRIVVTPSRRSLSKAQSRQNNNDLLRSAVTSSARTRLTRSRSLQLKEGICLTDMHSPQRTPTKTNYEPNQPKSILKTPGTAKSRRTVVFNEQLSVKKFRALKFDNDHQGTDYEDEEKVHIDDYHKMNASNREINTQSDDSVASERTYQLRNRRVKLRPSCEIEIPK